MFVLVLTGRVADAVPVREHFDRWVDELAAGAEGWLGNTAGVTDDGMLVLLGRFATREACLRADARPEHQAWEAKLLPLFVQPPVVLGSTSVDVETPGDPSKAGFVQVVQGRGSDVEQVRRLFTGVGSDGRRLRPEVLGSVTIGHPDGAWTAATYFTSEEAAGAGDRKLSPPQLVDLREKVRSLSLSEPVYLDLRDPWLHAPG